MTDLILDPLLDHLQYNVKRIDSCISASSESDRDVRMWPVAQDDLNIPCSALNKIAVQDENKLILMESPFFVEKLTKVSLMRSLRLAFLT